MSKSSDESAGLNLEQPDPQRLIIGLCGRWKIDAAVPSSDEALLQAESLPGLTHMVIDAQQLGAWDSTPSPFCSN